MQQMQRKGQESEFTTHQKSLDNDIKPTKSYIVFHWSKWNDWRWSLTYIAIYIHLEYKVEVTIIKEAT